jgi:nitrogen fixation NifU-like protein
VKGKTVDEAATIKNTQIAEELALPPVKIHCSILAEDAIKAAVADYRKKYGGGADRAGGVEDMAPEKKAAD